MTYPLPVCDLPSDSELSHLQWTCQSDFITMLCKRGSLFIKVLSQQNLIPLEGLEGNPDRQCGGGKEFGQWEQGQFGIVGKYLAT